MSQTAQSWWFVFYKDELLLEKKENGTFALPYGEIPPVFMIEKTTVHDVTTLEGSNCKAFSLARPIEESAKYALVGLRASYECLPVAHYQAAGKAHEILHWDRNSRFCSACGTPMEQKESIMKKCPNCGREVYPAISTAILVLVRKGDSILLVHARNFKGSFNSLVAGFLETGETLEECVAREVKEETGLDITECRYLFSIPNLYMYCGFEVHTVDMFFECHVKDFTGVHAEDDAAEIVIVKKEELKAEEFGLMSIKKAIRLYKENNC